MTVKRQWRWTAALAVIVALTSCRDATAVSVTERKAIADSLEHLVLNAYDFSRPNVPANLLSLYPDTGRVISAAGGQVTANHAALETGIKGFWQRVGQNMRKPKFSLGSSYVDVITRDAAVMTFAYSIPHVTPMGMQHTVTGAWTTLWRREGGRWIIVQEHLSDTPQSSATATIPAADSMVNKAPAAGAMQHQMPGMTMPPAPPKKGPPKN